MKDLIGFHGFPADFRRFSRFFMIAKKREKQGGISRFHAVFQGREKCEKGRKSADYLRNLLCFFTISWESVKKREISRGMKSEFRLYFKRLEFNLIRNFTISRPSKVR